MRIALVCMPFFSSIRPSLAIGTLTAAVRKQGIQVDEMYYSLDLAAQLGPEVYETLCHHRGEISGEWLFSRAAFADRATPTALFIAQLPQEVAIINALADGGNFVSHLREDILPKFIEDAFNRTDWTTYRVVGFSSTFQQHVASLALARRIKAASPGTAIVFGGANVESVMGHAFLRAFPFIDYVVDGEADESFPELLDRIRGHREVSSIPGVSSQTAQAPPIRFPVCLHNNPVPTFDGYFEKLDKLQLLTHPLYTRSLPFESSRGCWWGQKHHCTFCGLNGNAMRFRSKSPEQVLAELDALVQRYGISNFEATDNIADFRYYSTLFSRLADEHLGFDLFYEVKANLDEQQVKTLARAGVRSIQPGIESLSTSVLRLMRKGTTGLQNVGLLKWARMYGINVEWNLLYGFSGETEDDYSDQLEILRSIEHLQPPAGCFRVWLERFSPQFKNPGEHGITSVLPLASYELTYPSEVNLLDAAYFFKYENLSTVSDASMKQTRDLVANWSNRWSGPSVPTLTYRKFPSSIVVEDFRSRQVQSEKVGGEWRMALFEAVHSRIVTLSQLVGLLGDMSTSPPESSEIEAQLASWANAGWVVKENGKYLGVVLPVRRNAA